ncbi:hypothetical protein CJ030_MR8G020190 [Morella rubra]|uniref:Disease resistance protein At4g27190-like leucine-rich repeats domain-containing protein n=1 Tax=Morella rubra TaxID=262757 RepID=A0A6A1UQ71_9ROSI|nr:hypothetical protein CJ030_MR8G020190 [Morella rubra]
MNIRRLWTFLLERQRHVQIFLVKPHLWRKNTEVKGKLGRLQVKGKQTKDIRTLDDARNRLHKILGTLKVSWLLQDIPHDSERFRMHDIVLDVARYIASTELDQKMFVMGDYGGLHAWPDVDALQRCEALSVLGGDIRELPEGMQCPALKFFYINGGNLGAFQIPPSFFEAERPNNGRQNASLAELKHLPHLTNLEIHIPDASLLPRDLTFEKLERYEIVVGDVWDWSDKCETSRTLKLKLKTSIQAGKEVQKLLKRSERLFIDELKGIKSFVHELDKDDNLKHLNLERIGYGQLPTTSFGKLRIVKVECCQKLEFVVPSSVARGLSLIHVLEIKDCSIMRAIVVKEEGEIEDGDRILFPQLLKLVLHSLPKLLSFLSEGSLFMQVLHEQVPFPELRVLELSSIQYLEEMARFSGRLTNIQPITSRFQNLLSLIVKGCSNMRYLLSFSTARAMVQLQILQVVECKDIEEILTKDFGEEEIASPVELFPRLRNLFLQHLTILERFCVGRNIQFPSMKHLRIEKCPKLMTFIFKPVSSSMIAREEDRERTTDNKPHKAMQLLFNEEVAMPKLELLRISHIDGIESMWQNRYTANSCCKLRQVNVQQCANLKSFFPPTMMKVLGCLEMLIIEVPSFQEMDPVTATHVKKLKLTSLPKLKHIWEKDPEGTFDFQNLCSVVVVGCESLKSVFPASVSGRLKQLEFLGLDNCGVEVVIEKEGTQIAETLQFPKLTVLVLSRLPKLKYFSPGMRPSEWPSLKKLRVWECDKIEMFALTFQKIKLKASDRQPLFVVEEGAFPNLEDLTLELHSVLHNLETLRVCSNFWEEIFPYEVLFGQGNPARSLTNLRDLEFFENPMLTHLWKEDERLEEEKQGKEDMQPCPIFENLKILKVSECHKLSNLVPSTVSFQNLTNLEIFKCDRLIHLFTSSTARTLKELKILSVSGCRRITEIVGSEGGEANEIFKCDGLIHLFTSSMAKSLEKLKKLSVSECRRITKIVGSGGEANHEVLITFRDLAYLKLDCLAVLENFCSGSYSFNFPALEEVTVRQCPAMKIFCPGVLSTPKLKKVQATEEDQEGHWIKVDLNATIDWLWEHKL